MVARAAITGPAHEGRWPPLRRAAWAALFIAILGWSSLVQPPAPPEVLLWDVSVPA